MNIFVNNFFFEFYLIKIDILIGREFRIIGDEMMDAKSIIFLNLSEGVLYIGTGNKKEGRINLTFRTLEYFSSFGQFNEIRNIPSMTGFFFKST